MASEEEYWTGEFPPSTPGGEPTAVSGVYPNLERERQALRMISKTDKSDPLIRLKAAQENIIRLCVREIDGEPVTYSDLRGAGLEKYLSAKQLYMLTELFDSWQTPEVGEVSDFLSSVQMRTSSSKRRQKSTDEPDTGS